MADLFDRFNGILGPLSGHTADSGDTWGTGSETFTINGTGAVYANTTESAPNGTQPLSNWTPPGTDYAVAIVLGGLALVGAEVAGIGAIARGSGSEGSLTCYLALLAGGNQFAFLRIVGGTTVTLLGTAQTLGSAIQANDVLEMSVAGSGATVTLTAFYNGTQIYQTTDTDASRITSAGAAGMYLSVPVSYSYVDLIRAIWAGSIGGPAAGITPSSASVQRSGTHAFTATGGLPNETLAWTATHGGISGTPGTTVVYYAPSSGTSDAASWTSIDLPTHTASASITLTEAGTLILTGPTAGPTGAASNSFTVSATSLSGADTVTPASDSGGTFSPSSLTISSGSQTFTYTPSANGAHSISITDSLGAAILGSPITYTSSPWSPASGRQGIRPRYPRRLAPKLDFPLPSRPGTQA